MTSKTAPRPRLGGFEHAFSRPFHLETRNFTERRALRRSEVFQNPPLPPGKGMPVIMAPGFMGGEGSVKLLASWFKRAGYQPIVAPVGRNALDSPRMLGRVMDCLTTTYIEYQRPVFLLGHSRGGQLVRVAARRHPHAVAGVLTMGTPLRELLPAHAVVRFPVEMLMFLGRLGLSDQKEEKLFQADILKPLPEHVPFACIWSPSDGIVNGPDCRDPQADNIEVNSSHVGMLWNPNIYKAIAQWFTERQGDLHDA